MKIIAGCVIALDKAAGPGHIPVFLPNGCQIADRGRVLS
jgi:hypothetical protein